VIPCWASRRCRRGGVSTLGEPPQRRRLAREAIPRLAARRRRERGCTPALAPSVGRADVAASRGSFYHRRQQRRSPGNLSWAQALGTPSPSSPPSSGRRGRRRSPYLSTS
jgi:hypothetical protein